MSLKGLKTNNTNDVDKPKDKKKHEKFWLDIQALVVFLASSAFVKLHKEFMEPSSSFYPTYHITNKVHHFLHFVIGVGIQVILCLWLLKILIEVFVVPVWQWKIKRKKN